MALASYAFLLAFLPAALAAYALALRLRDARAGQLLLVLASGLFCAWAGPASLLFLAGSSAFTWGIARGLTRIDSARATSWLLGAGIAAHVGLLGFFKYTGFFADTLGRLMGHELALASPVLPLGISFITFQQIAWLVEASRDRTTRVRTLDYALFISFFPKLVAGPLADPGRFTAQLDRRSERPPSDADLGVGLTLLAVGLFKKVMIADELGERVDPIFAAAGAGGFVDTPAAWLGALAYTLQIYFDFSGYCDMALGAARCFGLRLPLNFDSPYQATNIGDFWRRWHMTLTHFLTRYLYTPMATPLTRWALSRSLPPAMLFAVTVALPTITTFTIAGLWHGAGLPFVVFGLLHGVYLTLHQGWRELRRARRLRGSAGRTGTLAAWALTFAGVVFAFVFFRASSLAEAATLIRALFGMADSAALAPELATPLFETRDAMLVAAAAGLALLCPNVAQLLRDHEPALDPARGTSGPAATWRWTPSVPWAVASALLWLVSLAALGEGSDFIYYRF